MRRLISSILLLSLFVALLSTSVFTEEPSRATEDLDGSDAMLVIDRVIGDIRVEYWEHIVDDIVFLKNDFILKQTNIESGEVIEYRRNWRNFEFSDFKVDLIEPEKEYFWKKLVVFLDRDDCRDFYTFIEAIEFPFVCWEIRYIDGTTLMYDLDGIQVGSGIPSPSDGFSLSGYHEASNPDPWLDFRLNADSWFNEWCEATVSISMPTPNNISSYVSDLDYKYFYELAHGSSHYFIADMDGSYYYSSTVTTDMFLRSPMKFAFIGSCDGMTETGPGTFSYEFRKGSMMNTVTVGYSGMASCPGWSWALEWQDYMFQMMDIGYTFKDSFDLASAQYPTIALCVKFVGDPNLKVPTPSENAIHIKTDGSIDPPTSNITSIDNATYTFTNNNYDMIVVERSNIVVDGNGYGLRGQGSGVGFNLSGTYNVTILNTNIKRFSNGISLPASSSFTMIYDNKIEHNFRGVALDASSNNTVVRNNIVNNTLGIYINESSHNTIAGNNITKHIGDCGIFLHHSSNNTIHRNNIVGNKYGIYLDWSSYGNTIYENRFIDNSDSQAIALEHTNKWDNGYPSGGNFWSDYYGIDLKSGPYKNETGEDGLGDTPYVINTDELDNFPLMKPSQWSPHDIGITDFEVSKTLVGEGHILQINVTIFNYGNNSERVSLMASANSTIIDTYENITLQNRASITLTIDWGTQGCTRGRYTLSIHIIPVQGEIDVSDNNSTCCVFVTIPGDVDGDRDVDMIDIVIISSMYGTSTQDPLYHPNCDFNNDGDIDIFDVVIAAINYGESW